MEYLFSLIRVKRVSPQLLSGTGRQTRKRSKQRSYKYCNSRWEFLAWLCPFLFSPSPWLVAMCPSLPRHFSVFRVTDLHVIFVIFQGFYEACERGFLTGHKLCGIRFVLEDGQWPFLFFWLLFICQETEYLFVEWHSVSPNCPYLVYYSRCTLDFERSRNQRRGSESFLGKWNLWGGFRWLPHQWRFIVTRGRIELTAPVLWVRMLNHYATAPLRLLQSLLFS